MRRYLDLMKNQGLFEFKLKQYLNLKSQLLLIMLSKLALSFCCSSNTDAVHIAIGEIVQLNEPSPGRRPSAPHLEITVEMSFGRIISSDFLYIAPATETKLPRRLS